MAKKFLGFTPDQQFTLLSKMGYGGPKEGPAMEQFLASNPAAASKLGDYTKKAQERIMKRNFAEGGAVTPTGTTPTTPPAPTTQLNQPALNQATQQTQQQATTSQQTSLNAAQQRLAELQRQAAANPTDQVILAT